MSSFLTTYTAYTDLEYQGVTNQVPYTGGGIDTYTGKSFNNFCYSVTFFQFSRELVRYSLSNFC